MAATQIKAKITGNRALSRLLQELPRSARKVNRAAANAAGTPMLQASRAQCPVDHGDLKRSLAKKVTNRAERANAVIGADEDYVIANGEKQHETGKDALKALRASGADITRPSKYDHLVIYGTQHGMQPNPFLQRAYDASIGTAQAIYADKCASGIEKEAEKMGNK